VLFSHERDFAYWIEKSRIMALPQAVLEPFSAHRFVTGLIGFSRREFADLRELTEGGKGSGWTPAAFCPAPAVDFQPGGSAG
jgi:hypothetical protein